MKSIALTYPDFQSLPKGLKRLLVASEELFFGQPAAKPAQKKLPQLLLPAPSIRETKQLHA